MIQEIIIAVVNFIVGFIALILTPIDNLILSFLPDLSNAFTAIGQYLTIISSSIGWAISLSGLSSATISLIMLVIMFLTMYFTGGFKSENNVRGTNL